MSRGKRYTAEQIIKILRELEIYTGQGETSLPKEELKSMLDELDNIFKRTIELLNDFSNGH